MSQVGWGPHTPCVKVCEFVSPPWNWDATQHRSAGTLSEHETLLVTLSPHTQQPVVSPVKMGGENTFALWWCLKCEWCTVWDLGGVRLSCSQQKFQHIRQKCNWQTSWGQIGKASTSSAAFAVANVSSERSEIENIAHYATAVQREAQKRQQRKFRPTTMMIQFYTPVIESILSSFIITWFRAAAWRGLSPLQRGTWFGVRSGWLAVLWRQCATLGR